MKIITTPLAGALIVEPRVFGDDRGFFLESFNQRDWVNQTGVELPFVQDNHSRSGQNVLRGLHYQVQRPQGKLVRVVLGEVFDVAVDLRQSSPSVGKWYGTMLSAENKRMFWVPPGFAHGFLVVSEYAEFLYKTTDYYAPDCERTIAWNDPELNIHWPLKQAPRLSAKDQAGVALKNAEFFP